MRTSMQMLVDIKERLDRIHKSLKENGKLLDAATKNIKESQRMIKEAKL